MEELFNLRSDATTDIKKVVEILNENKISETANMLITGMMEKIKLLLPIHLITNLFLCAYDYNCKLLEYSLHVHFKVKHCAE